MFTKTLTEVQDQVASDDGGKWDAIVPARQITLHHGRLMLPASQSEDHTEGLALTTWALSQACGRLGLPAAYFKRCPPDLQDANFNHWCQAEERLTAKAEKGNGSDSWLVRARGGTARAILSPSYAKLDNRELLEALFPILKATRYQVGLVNLSSEAFHLRLVDPSISRDVLPGDRICVGIHVSNSEVGLHACTVDALVLRLICTNGLIRRINHRSLLKQRHIHVSEPRFKEMLEDAVRESMTVAAGFIGQMALSIKVPVPNPARAIEILGEAWRLPKAVQEQIAFSLHGESHAETLYGLTNAITQVAQRRDMEERFRLETLASILVDSTSEDRTDHLLRQRILSGVK